MASIKVQKSRFALLKIEDDDSDDGQREHAQTGKTNASQTNAQKKKNKKKKQQNQAEINELKHLAFGAPNRNQPHPGSEHQHVNGANVPTRQWDEWQKMDAEYTAESFEKDLQQALLLSKLDTEQKKQQPNVNQSQRNGKGGDGHSKENKKKKKKDKQAMSLEEFNRKAEEKKTHSDELECSPSPISTKLPPAAADKKFFETVESDVGRILRQEKLQEEYKKQYAAESVITAKYQEQVNKLEKEVEFLRATMKKQEEELKQVKKRNKQLCVILGQGEMKGKAEVLMLVDHITEVKDELTEQVSELTAELEKERSKVHSFKSELDKLKGSKHK